MMNRTVPLAFRSAGQRELDKAEGTMEPARGHAPPLAPDIVGHLDLCGPELVEGWIFWHSRPGQALRLEVLIDGVCRGECSANLYRADLQQAGFGDGKCAFRFDIPRSAIVRDFASTRLRFPKSVLYLLPDASTKVWRARGRAIRTALQAVGQ